MTSGITVKVEMRPLFVDFVISKFGNEKGEIYATTRNKFGQLVKSLLQKQPYPYRAKNYEKEEHLEIILPEYDDLNNLYNNYLSENSEKIIRRWVRTKFYFDLHTHIMEMHRAGLTNIKIAIINFCDLHNINPDHYKENSLYKDFYRSRLRERNKNAINIASSFAGLLSAVCPLLVAAF